MILSDAIDRRAGLSPEAFLTDYGLPLRPVILTGAINHWPALGLWTPRFFKSNYGQLEVKVDGEAMTLASLVDRIEVSSESRPAPYLRNQLLSKWPPELMARVTPMPACTRPNWLESRFFPGHGSLTYVEIYIGGRGARFPVLHYDNWHTHAFLMQLHGDKEYLAFGPAETPFLYARRGTEINKSQIDELLHPDLSAFPLFERARGIRFELHPGETLFVPAGWWHTARILSPSVTVSINGVNRANGAAFRRDYCHSVRRRRPVKAALIRAALALGQLTNLFEI